ncbi:MAG: PfkB family carbohydrate kinase [Oceanipulchritudo sp.]
MKRIELAETLKKRLQEVPQCHAVTGFDGFVDEMITLVEERQSLDSFKRVEDITRFGDLVRKAAGHSSLREIVVTATHAGGCAVNMGDGLAALGLRVDTFATLGEPLHPAFAEYGKIATLHSWGREPGRTLAFEFADGKLMFSAVTQLAEFEPERVRGYLADGVFQEKCAKAPLIALTDWSMYPHMTSVWRLLQQEVFAEFPHRPWLFIDLVDPSSRSAADIQAMLEAMRGFGGPVRPVLGLNQNEANILSDLLKIPQIDSDGKEASGKQASTLREQLCLEQVVIHAHAYAVSATRTDVHAVDGPYCANPKKSTGAGDRFNAGYALGLILDLPIEACLLCAVASSGFFVRNARSAGLRELIGFFGEWDSGRV